MDDLAPLPPLDRLRAIMARLRDPVSGCPWDVEQTFATIAPYTIEEAYEVADAIEREAWDELKGELGDLLFQSVFHARMAEEAGLFDLDDVATAIADKMVARHPHVFGDESNAKSAEQQVQDWESRPRPTERAARATRVVCWRTWRWVLPALMRAEKLQKTRGARGLRLARGGHGDRQGSPRRRANWPDARATPCRKTRSRRRMGDLLFVMANLARHLKVDP